MGITKMTMLGEKKKRNAGYRGTCLPHGHLFITVRLYIYESERNLVSLNSTRMKYESDLLTKVRILPDRFIQL